MTMNENKRKLLDGITRSHPNQFNRLVEFFEFCGVSLSAGAYYRNKYSEIDAGIKSRVKSQTKAEEIAEGLKALPDKRFQSMTELAKYFGTSPTRVKNYIDSDDEMMKLCYAKVVKKPISERLRRKLKALIRKKRQGMAFYQIAEECGVTVEELSEQTRISNHDSFLVDQLMEAPEGLSLADCITTGKAWCGFIGHKVSPIEMVEGKTICKRCWPAFENAQAKNQNAIERHKQFVQSLRKAG